MENARVRYNHCGHRIGIVSRTVIIIIIILEISNFPVTRVLLVRSTWHTRSKHFIVRWWEREAYRVLTIHSRTFPSTKRTARNSRLIKLLYDSDQHGQTDFLLLCFHIEYKITGVPHAKRFERHEFST